MQQLSCNHVTTSTQSESHMQKITEQKTDSEVTQVGLFLCPDTILIPGPLCTVVCRSINHVHSTLHCPGRCRTDSSILLSFLSTQSSRPRETEKCSLYKSSPFTLLVPLLNWKRFSHWLNIKTYISCWYLGNQNGTKQFSLDTPLEYWEITLLLSSSKCFISTIDVSATLLFGSKEIIMSY